MSKAKATEAKLSDLHGKVAEVLNEQLGYKAADITYDEAGELTASSAPTNPKTRPFAAL